MLDRLTGWLGGLLGRKAGGPAGASADTTGELGTFLEALCAVSPDFARYRKLEGDEAAEAALRSVYAALPATGKVSRIEVAREFLVRLADEDDEETDAETISRLSERQLAIVARRAGVPI